MVPADGVRVDHNRAFLRWIPSNYYLTFLEGVPLGLALRIVEHFYDHYNTITIKSYLFEVNEFLDYVASDATHLKTQEFVVLVELRKWLAEVFGQDCS